MSKRTQLSPAMRVALRAIVRAFDAANAKEKARWGKALADINVLDAGNINPRTFRALADAGLILFSTKTHTAAHLRRGAYGRRLGGTRSEFVVNVFVAPTDSGRREAGNVEHVPVNLLRRSKR